MAALRPPLKTDLDLKVADELLGSEEIRVMLVMIHRILSIPVLISFHFEPRVQANYIRAVEGINGYNINRWMPLILTHDLARHYSLRGTEKKKVSHAYDCSASLSVSAICDGQFTPLDVSRFLETLPGETRTIERDVATWLKLAPDTVRKREKRRKMLTVSFMACAAFFLLNHHTWIGLSDASAICSVLAVCQSIEGKFQEFVAPLFNGFASNTGWLASGQFGNT